MINQWGGRFPHGINVFLVNRRMFIVTMNDHKGVIDRQTEKAQITSLHNTHKHYWRGDTNPKTSIQHDLGDYC